MTNYKNNRVGDLILEGLNQKGISLRELAKLLHQELGYANPKSCFDFLNPLIEGMIYGTYSSNPPKPWRAIKRTSRVIHSLGFEADSELVRLIHEMDSDFKYPPETD